MRRASRRETGTGIGKDGFASSQIDAHHVRGAADLAQAIVNAVANDLARGAKPRGKLTEVDTVDRRTDSPTR
jgi:hypothetical protein